MVNIILLGTGNVAKHLFDAFTARKEVHIVQVYGRKPKSLAYFESRVEVTTDISKIKDADILIIAIQDDAIAGLSNRIGVKSGLIVHTSGSVPLNALSHTNKRGVFYPLQTFSPNRKVDFEEIPICIEAENEKDYQLLDQLGAYISKNVERIDSEQRKSLHLGAVFVNNFPNHIYHVAQEICERKNVSFALLQPLIKETVAKLKELSPYEAQTGPAKRHDEGTIKKQLGQIENKMHKEIYSLMSKSIQKTYGKEL